MKTTASPNDDVAFIALLILASIGLLALTSVGALGAICVPLLAWFFGRATRVAFIALSIGSIAIAIDLISGGGVMPLFQLVYERYSIAARTPGVIPIVAVWLFGVLHPPLAWQFLFPAGLIVGAICTLLREDQKSSVRGQLWNFGRER